MYSFPYFKAENEQEVLAFMQAHPFVMLISRGEKYPVATQVPVLMKERDGKLFLQAHIMRKTDHHLAMEKDPQVLVVFSGAHTYVSASWYTNPQQGSTWNYQAVHAKGTVRFTDGNELLEILTRLTATFENNPASPSLMQHLPDSYVQPLLKAIVGVEIEVTDIDHVFKLSQNRDAENYRMIKEQLSKGDAAAQAVAREMKRE
jgi:transcriptional regulator